MKYLWLKRNAYQTRKQITSKFLPGDLTSSLSQRKLAAIFK